MDLILHPSRGRGLFRDVDNPRQGRAGAGRDRRVPRATRGDAGASLSGREVGHMDLTTVVIVLLIVVVLGGGGWGYSRWRR